MTTHTRKPVRPASSPTETDASKVSYYASRSLAPGTAAPLSGAKDASPAHPAAASAAHHAEHDHEANEHDAAATGGGRNLSSMDILPRTAAHPAVAGGRHADKDKDSKPAVADSHPQTEDSLAKTTTEGEAKKKGVASTTAAVHPATASATHAAEPKKPG